MRDDFTMFSNKQEVLSTLMKIEPNIEMARIVRDGYFDVCLELRMQRRVWEDRLAYRVRDFALKVWDATLWIELDQIEKWQSSDVPNSRTGGGTYLYHVRVYKRRLPGEG